MAANGSQEEIDFDFFDEDDNRGQSKDKSPAGIGGEKSRSRPSSGRPDSVRSTTSSLSIKIPTANNTPRERKENRYSSDEEDDYSPKGVNGYDEHDQKKGKSSDRSRSTSGESNSSKSRSKKSRSRHSSGTSNSSASYSSSLDSKSADSGSSSSSESVTDVSPIQSPLSRSPSPPRLRYNHDEMESSLAKSSKKLAKDSVRFKEPSPKSGFVRPPSGSRKNPQLEESEANELSMLLRAVLEMEETPQRRFRDFDQPRLSNSRPSSGKQPMSGKAMPHQRMNMSFSNDEVKKIDQDNERLLQKIMNSPSSVPQPKKERPSSGRMRTRSASYGSIPQARPASGHVSHSALLRQKDQRRIEMENMKILKRIESAKPTSQLQANKLKKDFRKQQQYAQQVSRTPVRPSSAKRAGNAGMTKATSLQSFRSEASSTASSRVRSRPSSAKSSSRPSWDEHFAY